MEGYNLLWLKMRPDTPQRYEYITVEDIEGRIKSFININPWTQFYDLKDRKDIPLSYAENIIMQNCGCECETFFDVKSDDTQYILSDFVFKNLHIKAKKNGFSADMIRRIEMADVFVNP